MSLHTKVNISPNGPFSDDVEPIDIPVTLNLSALEKTILDVRGSCFIVQAWGSFDITVERNGLEIKLVALTVEPYVSPMVQFSYYQII